MRLVAPNLPCIVSEHSEVMNLVLLAFYDMDPAGCDPSLDQIGRVLVALPKYGLPLDVSVTSNSTLYNLMVGLAQSAPLDTFALVCHHNLEELAVGISLLLLSLPLDCVTEEQSVTMGPSYFRRLVSLHVGRRERLKALLQPTPSQHPPTTHCNNEDQQKNMETIWRDTAADLLWNNGANTPASLLDSELNPVVDKLACDDCKAMTKERIQQVVDEWSSVKRTI
jgi:hypothetical protein